MKQITLNGIIRTISNKAGVKSIRRAGNVPCVVYGSGIENTAFSVNEKDLQTVTNTPFSHIIKLNIEGKEFLTILHEVQYHPVTDKALHADFLAITTDKPVTIEVPVRIFGNSEGVKQGGKLNVAVRKLRVKGLLDALPDELPVDITTLKLGKRINAGDLHYDGIEIVNPKATIVCSVRATRNSAAAAAAATE